MTITDRRSLRLLTGAWLVAGASIVLFAWMTAGSYVRQNFQPLAQESTIALRDCAAVASCARDAVSTIQSQQSLLHQATLLVSWTAWATTLASALVLASVTVLVFRQRQSAAARLLGIAWKTQAAASAALLVGHAALLGRGAYALGDIPEPARMFTFVKAFDSP